MCKEKKEEGRYRIVRRNFFFEKVYNKASSKVDKENKRRRPEDEGPLKVKRNLFWVFGVPYLA